MGLTVAMQAFNMLDHLVPFDGMGPVGEVRVIPDPSSFKFLPYSPRAAAMVADLLTNDGQPWAACPRSFLKRMIANAATHGLVVEAALENEFILCREVNGGWRLLTTPRASARSPCRSRPPWSMT